MADINITIGTPTLKPGEKFKVRYREMPGGAFIPFADQTNAPFTISGLNPGTQYEVEITFVLADGTQCYTVNRYFTTKNPFTCDGYGFSVQLIQDPNTLYYIELSYTPGAVPPCGWEIEYTQQGQMTQFISYTTLPLSGLIRIPVNNISGVITVRALLCNGASTICFESDFNAVILPPCVPIVITEVILTGNPPPSPGYTLSIEYTQSTPATRNGRVIFQQTGIPAPGQRPLDNGTWFPVGFGGPGQINQVVSGTVTPTVTLGVGIYYTIQFIDDCEVSHIIGVAAG